MPYRRGACLAIVIVKRGDFDRVDRACIETAHVDVDAVRIRARHVERFNAAYPTEQMLRRSGVERVFAQVVLSREQSETRSRHNQVQVAGHCADRAIAFQRMDFRRRIDFESNSPAMTRAPMDNEFAHDRAGRTYQRTADTAERC